MTGRAVIAWRGVLAAWAWALLAGCGPSTDAERAYYQARQAEQRQREDLRRTLEGGTEEAAAIRLVKEAAAADGQGTTEQWLGRQLDTDRLSMLFPRWQARRRGTGKYDVRFTCTLMGGTGEITKRGFAWTVDLVLKLVSPARELAPEELSSYSSRYFHTRRTRPAPPAEPQIPVLPEVP